MVPAALLLVVGMVYGVEEEQGKVEMVGLLACPEREGGGWLACGGEGRCISKTQVNQIISLCTYLYFGKSFENMFEIWNTALHLTKCSLMFRDGPRFNV